MTRMRTLKKKYTSIMFRAIDKLESIVIFPSARGNLEIHRHAPAFPTPKNGELLNLKIQKKFIPKLGNENHPKLQNFTMNRKP